MRNASPRPNTERVAFSSLLDGSVRGLDVWRGSHVFLLVGLLFLTPFPLRAWPGYDWDRWRAVSKEDKPVIESPQAGLEKVLPLLETGGADSRNITDAAGWNTKRERIYTVLTTLLGEPANLKPSAPEAKFLGELDAGDHVRHHIRIRSESDDWISAYILLPKSTPAARLPVMIVIHQTVRQGKDEPCGVDTVAPSNPDLRLGLELVRRGYAVLAPDMIGFGERISDGEQPYDGIMKFFDRHPHWSVFGKTAWDANRMVDWLETQPWADTKRIGVIGHSHGAYSSIMSAAFEPRIRAVIASCGFTMLRLDPRPDRWSHMTPLLPRLGFFTTDIKSAPTDWHEIIALLTPRALFDWQPLQDDNFQNTGNLPPIFDDLRAINLMLGQSPDAMRLMQAPGPHSFPVEARTEAYDWLDTVLKSR